MRPFLFSFLFPLKCWTHSYYYVEGLSIIHIQKENYLFFYVNQVEVSTKTQSQPCTRLQIQKKYKNYLTGFKRKVKVQNQKKIWKVGLAKFPEEWWRTMII